MSKELEALNRFGRNEYANFLKRNEDWALLETALKDYERLKETLITATRSPVEINKEHKALEIIKEKEVDCGFLKSCIVRYNEKALEHYNEINRIYGHEPLTQEEYDLLKEVLL